MYSTAKVNKKIPRLLYLTEYLLVFSGIFFSTDRPREEMSAVCKQFILGYLFLNHIIVVIVSDSVCCYHDKVKRSFVFRQLLVCTKLVLQFFGIITVYGKGTNGVFHLTDVRKPISSLYNQVNLSPTPFVGTTGKPRAHICLNAGNAKGCFYLRDMLKAYTLKGMPLPGVM